MKNAAYDYGYGINWKDVHVDYKEGYYTSVSDFHEHDFYEINLILSGNFKILLSDRAQEGMSSRIVLTKPNTPHFISCKPDTLYSRLYLVFSKEFITNCVPEWSQIVTVFGQNGKIVTLNEQQRDFCAELIHKIDSEPLTFRKKLLVVYLLSYISEFAGDEDVNPVSAPTYLIEALNYIEENYHEKITAAQLAQKLYIGRTTLMTAFKKYTGSTLNDYIIHYRLKKAMLLLDEGRTEAEAAECCGLGDSSGFIRCFKRSFGITPRQYLAKER